MRIRIITFLLAWTAFLSIDAQNHRDYRLISKKEELKNLEIISFYKDRGVTFLSLDDSSKIAIPDSRNYDYSNPFIYEFIQVGDKLIKTSGTDSLFILRNQERHLFKVGEILNGEKREHSMSLDYGMFVFLSMSLLVGLCFGVLSIASKYEFRDNNFFKTMKAYYHHIKSCQGKERIIKQIHFYSILIMTVFIMYLALKHNFLM